MPLFGKKKKDKDDKEEAAEESEQNESGISLDNLDLSDDNDSDTSAELASELSILDSALGGTLDSLDDETEGEDGEGENGDGEDDALSQDLLDIFAGESETDTDLSALTHGLEDVDAASLLIQAQQVLALLVLASTFWSITTPAQSSAAMTGLQSQLLAAMRRLTTPVVSFQVLPELGWMPITLLEILLSTIPGVQSPAGLMVSLARISAVICLSTTPAA